MTVRRMSLRRTFVSAGRRAVAIPVERSALVVARPGADPDEPALPTPYEQATAATDGITDALSVRLHMDESGAASLGLTPREMEVLRIICEGRTDREISERLYISERTVHVHVRRVLAKLGVSTRTQAAALALRQGIVPMAGGVPAAS